MDIYFQEIQCPGNKKYVVMEFLRKIVKLLSLYVKWIEYLVVTFECYYFYMCHTFLILYLANKLQNNEFFFPVVFFTILLQLTY